MIKIFKIFLIVIIIIFKHFSAIANEEKIKIGLLIPMTGENMELGKLLIKSTKLALGDINTIK